MFDLVTTNNGRYTVTYISDDLYIGKCIANGFEWDGWMRDIIKNFYKPNTDILDIGGNIGYNALMFSDYAPVHTFEPKLHDILTKNVNQNNLKNPITVHPYGLSSQETTSKLYHPKLPNYGGYSIHQIDEHHSEHYDIIQLKRLDDVYTGVPSIIKMDIEGHEQHCLLGSKKIIEKYKPTLLVEIHDSEKEKMFPFISELGYKYCFACPEKVYVFYI